MPVLDNQKHELFAQAIAKGASQREAYRKAGYTASGAAADVNACKLLSDTKVSDRVKEIQATAANRVSITLESWIEEGADLMRKALAAGDSAAASQQYERVAKVAGFWIEKTESTQTLRGFSSKPTTAEEWQQQYAAADSQPLN